jgi:hypothetical protein
MKAVATIERDDAVPPTRRVSAGGACDARVMSLAEPAAALPTRSADRPPQLQRRARP